MIQRISSRTLTALALCAAVLGLSACSMFSKKEEAAPLPADPGKLVVREVWRGEIGTVDFPLVVSVSGNAIGLASSEGVVALYDVRTGERLWRIELNEALIAGVGHDGTSAAVITASNDLVVLQSGKELWRQRLSAPSYTPPLVAGARVFVLGSDRSVQAFDGQSGRRLWNQTRTGEALVLKQPGVLQPVGDTLIAGVGSRLLGLNPLNGVSRWEMSIASARGTNDVERLVDLVSGVSRVGTNLCLRAFQSSVGCVDANRGNLVWTKTASGSTGLSGDDSLVVGTEFDGTLLAWRRSDGDRTWSNTMLRLRKPGTPVLMGETLAVGDAQGLIHFFSRQDGVLLSRYDANSPGGLAAAPVLAGNTLVIVTRKGRVVGLRPAQN